MKASPTRTLNPLPFTDLEPKRFEDLVRQLIYDYKTWRRLEATGRSGSDDGFDARGLEITQITLPSESRDAEEEEPLDETTADRLWLIQCKREREIGPTKVIKYLDEINLSGEVKLHGIIFAAACDFSKKARDNFYSWCRTHGIQEAIIWGKGEIEDMLFQPKNDGLLFAYFGISLTIRQRSQATQIRANIATKRKLKRTVLTNSAEVLVRDPSDQEYPFVEAGKTPDKWWVFPPEELTYAGLSMSVGWFYAYLDPKSGEWDAARMVGAMRRHHLWAIKDPKIEELRDEARQTWEELPDENKAWLKVSGVIALENILAVDECGDNIFPGVHIVSVNFAPSGRSFLDEPKWLPLLFGGNYFGYNNQAGEPQGPPEPSF